MRVPVVATSLMLSLLVAGCAADMPERLTVERVDSAGIEIVRNEPGELPLDRRFERAFRVGGEPEGPASFYAVRPEQVGVDGEGNLYVLDEDDFRVAVFDAAGRPLRTVGRQGGGPGELEAPYAIVVEPDGTVTVGDGGKGALVPFAPDGAPLPERPFGTMYLGWPIALTPSGVVILRKEYRAGRDRLLALGDGEPVAFAILDGMPPAAVAYPACGLSLRQPPLFAPELAWTARGDTVFAATSSAYRIDIFVATRLRASVRRDVPPRAATEALAVLEAERRPRSPVPNCTLDPDDVVRGRGFAPVLPAVSAIAAAPDGTLWVRRGAVVGEPAAIDLFDAGGAYLGTLPPGSPFPAAFFPDGRIAAIERDDMDIQRVVVYRVVREDPV